jgi:hypothetical protein
MTLGHIQRGQRALVGHQVLHLSGTPHGVQPNLTLVTAHGAETPQRVVQSVAVEDRAERQRLVIGLRFAEVAQQLRPAV